VKRVKIDGRSLILGIFIGIVVGSVMLVMLTRSLPFGFTAAEEYTVTMRIKSEPKVTWSPWNIEYNHTVNGPYVRYPYGVTARFLRDNVTVGEYQIWYSPAVNITLQKGDYTIKTYEGKSGLYIETLQIYVTKDVEIGL
jgi:hypothetical protein